MNYTVIWGCERDIRHSWLKLEAVRLAFFFVATICITCGCEDSASTPTLPLSPDGNNLKVKSTEQHLDANNGVVDPSREDSEKKSFQDTTPLIQAILDLDEDQFEQLLEKGVSPNEWDKYGRNAVTVAAAVPNNQLWIQYILAHGGDANSRAPESIKSVPLVGGGFAPLHIAASTKDCEFNVRLLVEAGADVNALNAYGMTPLGLAVDSSLFEVASYLIEHGADPNTTCSGNVTVRELLENISSDDYPFVLSPEDTNSLKYLRGQITELDTK